MLAEQFVDMVEQVITDLRPGQVEHILAAKRHLLDPVRLQDPIRVIAIELAVGIDHFWLEPETELQIKSGDMFHQRA